MCQSVLLASYGQKRVLNVNLSFQNIIYKVKSMSRSKYVQIKYSSRKTVDIETKKNCKKYFFKSISRKSISQYCTGYFEISLNA